MIHKFNSIRMEYNYQADCCTAWVQTKEEMVLRRAEWNIINVMSLSNQNHAQGRAQNSTEEKCLCQRINEHYHELWKQTVHAMKYYHCERFIEWRSWFLCVHSKPSSCVHLISSLVSHFCPSPQVGGKWQQDAVAMLREMLLNRSVDIDIMVEFPETHCIVVLLLPTAANIGLSNQFE